MKTMIAIPCMDTVPTRFASSLLRMRRTPEAAVVFGMNSLIYDTRNKAAMEAIQGGFDRVLWLDSDMEFQPDLMERLSARMDEGRDFVTGLYFQRKDPFKPVIYRELYIRQREDGAQEAVSEACEEFPPDGIFEVAACGFGIAMTSVQLLRDVTEKYGMPFTPIEGWGEDLAFCLRATDAGYRIWCDSSIRAGHIGLKTFYEEDWRRVQTKLRL